MAGRVNGTMHWVFRTSAWRVPAHRRMTKNHRYKNRMVMAALRFVRTYISMQQRDSLSWLG